MGDAGVGKTAIAEGLARMIVEGEVPEVMEGATIYTLDLGALLAGTKYRGDFEKRLKGLLAQLAKKPKSILFIDEIHTIIGAGAASGGVMDASNLIKPMLASGELRCIGSTTYTEYRGIFDKDRALSRRFQMIEVNEPSLEETGRILRGLKSRFEEHHQVRFTRQALEAAVSLADRYINDRLLPDKAIDVIDEAGASQRLLPPSRRKKTIGVAEVESVVAKIARIPPRSVSRSDREVMRHLDRDLKLLVFGQDRAIETLVAAVRTARSGLGDADRPVGCFLLAGPTGVGKTEVTRQLAILLGVELVRFDMSEYMERHTVSRLIGAPPGYVGFDQGGLLTEAINKHPHSVLLLDEIEKAHPDVFNILLQVMDHGTLTDNNGRKADFRNVAVVMTTNAGAEQRHRRSMGFTTQDHSPDAMEAISKTFSPEFRNRLDAVVEFDRLDRSVIGRIVDKFIFELENQLDEKRVTLELTDPGAGVAGRARVRPHDGRPSDGPRHPGTHQAPARGRAAVRKPRRRRSRDHPGRSGRHHARLSAHPSQEASRSNSERGRAAGGRDEVAPRCVSRASSAALRSGSVRPQPRPRHLARHRCIPGGSSPSPASATTFRARRPRTGRRPGGSWTNESPPISTST